MADTTKTRPPRAPREPVVDERALGAPIHVPAGEGGAEIEEALGYLRHQRNCPNAGGRHDDEGSRIEVIRHQVSGKGLDPERGGSTDGYEAIVVRCIECGAQEPDDR